MNPGGTGNIYNKDAVLKRIWFSVHGNGFSNSRIPDIPDPGHMGIFCRPVFAKGGCQNIADVNQFFVFFAFGQFNASCFWDL